MKKLMVTVVAVAAVAASTGIAFGADEARSDSPAQEVAELEVGNVCWNNWRIMVGGFGRGNMRAKVHGLGSERAEVYGADLDLQYNVWQNRNFNIWAGVGGTFCPRQKMSDGYGSSSARSEHQVSDDGYTTYDFNYRDSAQAEVEMAYGELRLMMVPEWKVTDSFALGARIGVAFDWINAKCSYRNDWAWNSRFDINIPGLDPETDVDSDSGATSNSDSQTEFAAQAILGLQATYMFTDWVGLYANFDWRLGSDADFDCGAGNKATVDLDGWYWGAGVVVSF